jgi:hypothetical protein
VWQEVCPAWVAMRKFNIHSIELNAMDSRP